MPNYLAIYLGIYSSLAIFIEIYRIDFYQRSYIGFAQIYTLKRKIIVAIHIKKNVIK